MLSKARKDRSSPRALAYAVRRALQLRRPTIGPYIGVSVVLIVLISYFSITERQFATVNNVLNILQTNSTLLIIAVGVTFTVLAGGFDLSIGGVLVLTS